MITSAMNFPIWDLNGMNGGLLIALIAVIHVFVAQFAVGGGFFLVFAERKGFRENSPQILKWVHWHTRFFLLVTMVFGGITGVGIWLVTSLVSPAGISVLIREFVYAWAAEWVFFLGEILALLLYAASFGRCRDGQYAPRDHMILGAAYAVFAFLSLFIINGIISFMLTPGDWVRTGAFWDAFFNPGFLPSLMFRFGLSLTLAGMFGLITATNIKHEETREDMVRFCAQWICLPFVLMLVGIVAYIMWGLPEELDQALQRGTDDIRPFLRSFLDAAPVLFLAGMFLFIRLPKKVYLPYVSFVLLLGLVVVGSFEWVRETVRRPWLVYGYMYSNGITLADGKRMNEKGALANSGWGTLRAGTKEPLAAGRFLFTQQCSSCHGLGAPMLDIKPRVKDRGEEGIAALLGGQGKISPYMPPFFGTEEERLMLARWLASLEEQGKALARAR